MDRIGGEPVLFSIINNHFETVLDHPHLSDYFRKIDIKSLKQKVVDFLVTTLGGMNRSDSHPRHSHLSDTAAAITAAIPGAIPAAITAATALLGGAEGAFCLFFPCAALASNLS